MDADERRRTGSAPGNEHAGSDLRPSVFISGLLFRACAMKLEYQSRWFRVLIELFPAVPAIRHYRIATAKLDGSTSRFLRRQIHRRLRDPEQSVT